MPVFLLTFRSFFLHSSAPTVFRNFFFSFFFLVFLFIVFPLLSTFSISFSTAELSDSKEELSILRESLSASSTAKNDLQYLCAEHSRFAIVFWESFSRYFTPIPSFSVPPPLLYSSLSSPSFHFHCRQSEIAAADTIRVFSDRILLEREEFLSRFSVVS
jgi:hypothetical protein